MLNILLSALIDPDRRLRSFRRSERLASILVCTMPGAFITLLCHFPHAFLSIGFGDPFQCKVYDPVNVFFKHTLENVCVFVAGLWLQVLDLDSI